MKIDISTSAAKTIKPDIITGICEVMSQRLRSFGTEFINFLTSEAQNDQNLSYPYNIDIFLRSQPQYFSNILFNKIYRDTCHQFHDILLLLSDLTVFSKTGHGPLTGKEIILKKNDNSYLFSWKTMTIYENRNNDLVFKRFAFELSFDLTEMFMPQSFSCTESCEIRSQN